MFSKISPWVIPNSKRVSERFIFYIKNNIFKKFLKIKIGSKYTPKRTKLHHLKKIIRGACPRAPLAKQRTSDCTSEPIYPSSQRPRIPHTFLITPFCQIGPRYEGQLTRLAEPIPPSGQSTSYTLTTLSSSKIYGPTGSDGTWIVKRRGRWSRTILVAVWGVGRAVYLGPRPASQHYPYTNYLRLGWWSTDRPLPMNDVRGRGMFNRGRTC